MSALIENDQFSTYVLKKYGKQYKKGKKFAEKRGEMIVSEASHLFLL